MSQDQFGRPAYEQEIPVRKSSSGCWWGLGIGCGLLLLACCGGVGFFGYMFAKGVQVSEDPAVASRLADEIANFDVPDSVSPKESMKFEIPFFTAIPKFRMVIYHEDEGTGVMILGEFTLDYAEANPEQIRAQMDQTLAQQGRNLPPLTDVESKDFTTDINGQPATFRISTGKNPDDGQSYVRVQGPFKTEKGTGFIFAQLREEGFSKEQAEDLIKSIK